MVDVPKKAQPFWDKFQASPPPKVKATRLYASGEKLTGGTSPESASASAGSQTYTCR